MNSKQMFQRGFHTALTTGALMLAAFGAQAQVVSTPYGNLPAGARPVQLSPSAPYTTNPYNTNTQNYSVFGGTNGSVLYGNGLGSYYDYFGVPFGYADNISVLSDPYYGGFVGISPYGAYFTGADGMAYNPFSGPSYVVGGNISNSPITPVNPYGYSGRALARNRAAQNQANSVNSQPTVPLSLAQQVGVQQGRSFDLKFTWRGDPSQITGMTVTLLNRYHLPIASASAAESASVSFPGNTTTYAARYYRVDVQYANGTTDSTMATLKR